MCIEDGPYSLVWSEMRSIQLAQQMKTTTIHNDNNSSDPQLLMLEGLITENIVLFKAWHGPLCIQFGRTENKKRRCRGNSCAMIPTRFKPTKASREEWNHFPVIFTERSSHSFQAKAVSYLLDGTKDHNKKVLILVCPLATASHSATSNEGTTSGRKE